MKYLLTLTAFLATPLYAHVSEHAAPQHSIEHMLIGAALIAVVAIGYRLIRKNQ